LRGRELRDGDTWRSRDRIALVNLRGGMLSLVIFHASGNTVAFERILEMPSEDKARAHLSGEGYAKSDGRIRMADRRAAKPISPAKGQDTMPVEPGQIWQNGRVVVSVQKAIEGLNLVEFEIKGRGLKFTDAKPFRDPTRAARYIESLNCGLTNKVLSAAAPSASAI